MLTKCLKFNLNAIKRFLTTGNLNDCYLIKIPMYYYLWLINSSKN